MGRFAKILLWLVGYSSLQVLLAVANAVAGFLLIRILDKPNYAWFTIAFAGLSIIQILADSGLISALTYLGGPLNAERPKLSKLYEMIGTRRRVLSTVALAIVVPLSGWMLLKNEASLMETSLILFLLGIIGWATVSSTALLAVCRLTKDLNVVFESESFATFGKLFIYMSFYWIGANAISTLASMAVLQCLQLWLLMRSAKSILGPPGASDATWQKEMTRSTREVMPIAIWSCIQGILLTFVLSLAASVNQVAEIGALGRFSAAFTLAYVPIVHYFLPALARTRDSSLLKRRLFTGIAAFGLVLVIVCLIGFIAPDKLLLLLGPQYSHLDKELVLYLVCLALGMFAQLIWGVNFSRGWTNFAWIYIPLTILFQVAIVAFVDVQTVFGVIQLGLVGGLASLGTAVWLTLRGLKRFRSRDIALEKEIVVA